MPTPLTEKQQYWSIQVQNAEAFDGSIADYARSQGVSQQTLYAGAIACVNARFRRPPQKRSSPKSSVRHCQAAV